MTWEKYYNSVDGPIFILFWPLTNLYSWEKYYNSVDGPIFILVWPQTNMNDIIQVGKIL